MGISPHRWQMNLRVLEAQEMLRAGKRSQADIALALVVMLRGSGAASVDRALSD